MPSGDTSAATGPGDERLRKGLGRGDVLAFAGLIAEHERCVAGLAYRLLGWRAEVEDVVQDVFVAALENLPRFRGECRLATWLYRITVNQCRRQRRKRLLRLTFWGTPPALGSSPAFDGASAGDPSLAREKYERVRAAVAKLPQSYREVVVLRYLEELPIAEIGEILGLRPNAVEVRLSRARERLKGLLAEWVEA